jgi:hypothetical protein
MSRLGILGFLILLSYIVTCTGLVWATLWFLLRLITDNNKRRIVCATSLAAVFFLREFAVVFLR